MLTFSCLFLGIFTNVVLMNINTTSSKHNLPDNNHGHYHINKFNQLADDDRTVQHTEDISDYNMNEDYEDDNEPDYQEGDYYDNEETESEETPPTEDKPVAPGSASVQKTEPEDRNETDRNNTGNTGMKWFHKQTPNESNGDQSQLPKEENLQRTSTSSASESNGSFPNEAELQDRSNVHSRIKNIKENANRLNNEKIIYADEKFLLLKFQLTPLNDSNVHTVLNAGVEEIDEFEQKFNERKSKDSSGLFDSSTFDDDDSFFREFDDSRRSKYHPGKPTSNFQRGSVPQTPTPYSHNYYKQLARKNNYPKKVHKHEHKEYKSDKGVWIGNKYYPYHGPSFNKPSRPSYHFGHRHHGYDFSDEDYSDFSECSDEYESSEEDYGGDPGILYGQPRPGLVPVPGPVPNPGGVPIPGVVPTPGTGVLYGRPGVPLPLPPPGSGVLYGNSGPGIWVPNNSGTGAASGNRTTGNNTDVVLVVIAAQ